MIAPHIAARIQERLTGPEPADVFDQSYSGADRSYLYDAAFTPLDPRDPASAAYIARVRVKWLEGGTERSESFETIVLRRLPR